MSKTERDLLKILKNKNIQERNAQVLSTLEYSIKSIITKLKLTTRLNDRDDLLQEARIVILEVLSKNILNYVKCSKSTYLLAAVKNRVLTMYSKEFVGKRLAQTIAFPLVAGVREDTHVRGNWQDVERRLLKEYKSQKMDLLEKQIFYDKIKKIKFKLSFRAKLIFALLLRGNTQHEISQMLHLGKSLINAIIQRKIKPIVKKCIYF